MDDEPAKPAAKPAAARAESEPPKKKSRLFDGIDTGSESKTKPSRRDDEDDDDRPRNKRRPVDADDDDDDRPRNKRRPVDEDDDDDDRPRRKRRRDDDDDDDDDRPRNKRRPVDDDDDDDDDRPRKKKRRRDEDDDDDWAESGSKKVAGAGAAKTGMLMVSISLLISLGTFALLTLFTMIGWAGGYLPVGLMVIPGILGLAGTIVGIVGSSFCIGGPAKARPLAIAATAVAAVHLILPFIVANNGDAGIFSDRTIQVAALQSKAATTMSLMEDSGKDTSKAKQLEERRKADDAFEKEYREELKSLFFYEVILHAKEKEDGKLVAEILKEKAPTEMRWIDTSTQLTYLDKFLAVAAYHSKYFTDYLLGFLAGLIELAQIVLFLFLIGAVSKSVRGGAAIGKVKVGLIAVAAVAGVAVVLSLIGTALRDSAEKEIERISKSAFEGGNIDFSDPGAAERKLKELRGKVKGAQWMGRNAPTFTRFANYALYTAMLAIPALAALQASSEAGRRARRS